MPAFKESLCLEAAEKLHWPRLYSLGIGPGLMAVS